MQDAAQIWKQLLSNPGEQRKELLHQVEKLVLTSHHPAEVSFGTSGWRGELGTEFTLRNVQVVAEAIVQMYREANAELLASLGVRNFEEFQQRGLVLGHDNRFMNPEFARVVAGVFCRHGIRVLYAGEASTPEYSAGVEMLALACAVNLTPSHNPANYGGFKFNPADGGPAGPEITNVITRLANARMPWHEFHEDGEPAWQKIDLLGVYIDYLQKKKTLDLPLIRGFAAQADVAIVTDHVHGATRGRPGRILGAQAKLTTLRTNDDVLFGGIAPEPSSKNMAGVMQALKASSATHKIGVIFDPDGDRVRFTDGETEIPMNYFGAMALHYLFVHRGVRGVLAKSVATSNFANAIANKLGIPIEETAVGFKNFRPFTRPGANPMAIVAFEESDGISGYNNTIEKDAEFGLLLAIEMVAKLKISLGAYLRQLQAEFGAFYPERSGFEVDKSMVGAPLKAKVTALANKVQPGLQVPVGKSSKTVAQVLTLDGVKIIFGDESWMLVRPSGTEPKVRIYAECRDLAEKDAMFEAAQALFKSV
jgi:phosphomannomutase